jgi:hypothetical protein
MGNRLSCYWIPAATALVFAAVTIKAHMLKEYQFFPSLSRETRCANGLFLDMRSFRPFFSL